MTSLMTCATCRFFASEVSQCRRRAPTVIPTAAQPQNDGYGNVSYVISSQTEWPFVTPQTRACGEHEKERPHRPPSPPSPGAIAAMSRARGGVQALLDAKGKNP